MMAGHASGTFDVKIVPQKDEGVGDPTIGRMSIDKVYHGDLDGTGLGQMLAGMAAEVRDSGGALPDSSTTNAAAVAHRRAAVMVCRRSARRPSTCTSRPCPAA